MAVSVNGTQALYLQCEDTTPSPYLTDQDIKKASTGHVDPWYQEFIEQLSELVKWLSKQSTSNPALEGVVPELILQQLSKMFPGSKYDIQCFCYPDYVVSFLSEKQNALLVLNEAKEMAEEVFGDNVQSIRYEISTDPESEKPHQTLFMLIQTELDVSSAVRLMDIFDDWWFDNMHRANNLISVDVEFL